MRRTKDILVMRRIQGLGEATRQGKGQGGQTMKDVR